MKTWLSVFVCGVSLAAAAPAEKVILHFDAAGVSERTIQDLSGNGNSALLPKGVKVRNIKGRRVFQFDGVASVAVKHSTSLDPAQKPLRVEAVARLERFSNGVLAAMGGNILGYSLAVQNGRPLFAVRANKEYYEVRAEEPVEGWVTVTGRITPQKRVELLVNGRPVAAKPAAFITKVPNDTLSIGSDTGSAVIDPAICAFAGFIQSVRIIDETQ
jgi:hypothetical protein